MAITQWDDVAPWPEANPRAVAGDNKPPLSELIPAEYREELLRERPDFLTKLDALIDAAERAKAVDDETLGKCGDLVNAYRKAFNHAKAAHTTVKAPYLEGSRLVDAEFNAIKSRLDDAKAKVEAIGNAFVAKREAEARAERARIDAERREAERKEAEARQAMVDAAQDAFGEIDADFPIAPEPGPMIAPKAEPIRSDAGAVVSGKKEWRSEVTDFALAFSAVSSDEKVRGEISKAVQRLVKAGMKDIPGVRIWAEAKASFR